MRRDLVAPLAIAAIVLVTRLPFVTHTLWAWDSVLYANALERGFHVDFDLGEQRPQPPGYILYIATAALLRGFTDDSNAALVLLSVIASAVGAAALYRLARRFTGMPAAALVAGGYAFNPLVWTYAEIAYPYALLGLLAVVLATAFWDTRAGGRAAHAWISSFAFGLLTGYRQDLALLLGALWVWMLWPSSRRTRAIAALAALAGVALWFAPSAILSDGLDAYVFALQQQSESVRSTYSVGAQGLAAFGYNLRFTLYSLSWGLLGFGVVLAALVAAPILHAVSAGGPRGRLAMSRRRNELGFFLTWVVPGLAFYVAVHIGEWGYVLSVLPALYVLLAALLEEFLLQRLRGAARRAWPYLGAAVVAGGAALFVFGLTRFSAYALSRHDQETQVRVSYLREHFPKERTIVLAREDFLLVRYYLPEYRAWLYDPDPYASSRMRKRAMRATAIVIFTQGLRPRQELDVRYVEAAPGVAIEYVPIEPGSVVEFSGERFMVRDPQ
ncbi:MAG: glycosyltransferase family 39 protein [Chloroflexota bacterium]|nr:glycosyltransferase family 39 protein [Chloroflexota bacterium]